MKSCKIEDAGLKGQEKQSPYIRKQTILIIE